MAASSPQSIVVMGVSGCGKSTVAQALAAQLGLEMIDGDDLHLPHSVAKMRAGQALNDADRWPWLDRIGQCLAQLVTPDLPSLGRSGRVVACSALKRSYRDRLRNLAPAVRFVFLDGDAELIRQRWATTCTPSCWPASCKHWKDRSPTSPMCSPSMCRCPWLSWCAWPRPSFAQSG